jgi:hypothetical protein
VAFRSVTAICDDSSQMRTRGPRRQVFVAGVVNQAHANQTIDMSGAVRRQSSMRSVFIAGTVRLARLCVLIVNPFPARRSIHLDLAGSRIHSCAALCFLFVDPPVSQKSAGFNNCCKGPGTGEDAVSTYNLFSWVPENPGESPGGCYLCNLALRTFSPTPDNLDAGGPEHPNQFTNRRMRIFITTPSARKVNNTEDPP